MLYLRTVIQSLIPWTAEGSLGRSVWSSVAPGRLLSGMISNKPGITRSPWRPLLPHRLGAPSTVSNKLKDFLLELHFAKWKLPCPLKDEIKGLLTAYQILDFKPCSSVWEFSSIVTIQLCIRTRGRTGLYTRPSMRAGGHFLSWQNRHCLAYVCAAIL